MTGSLADVFEREATGKRSGAAVVLAISAHRLAWGYRCAVYRKWAPRAEELRQLDAFHRTHVAWENAGTRGEWLCEETAHVLLRAVEGRRPFGLHASRLKFFERCQNQRWLRALVAYRKAFAAAVSAGTWDR